MLIRAELQVALDELGRRYRDRARLYARRRLGRTLRRRVDSEDVVQEALVEAARVAAAGGPAAIPVEGFTWLARIIDHRILHLARDHGAAKREVRREVRLSSDDVTVPADRRLKTPSALLQNLERRHQLDDAIACLSPRERELVQLIYFHGCKVREAAELMGKSPNATAVLHSQALRRLRHHLDLGDDDR